jgi:hypothetical protein
MLNIVGDIGPPSSGFVSVPLSIIPVLIHCFTTFLLIGMLARSHEWFTLSYALRISIFSMVRFPAPLLNIHA